MSLHFINTFRLSRHEYIRSINFCFARGLIPIKIRREKKLKEKRERGEDLNVLNMSKAKSIMETRGPDRTMIEANSCFYSCCPQTSTAQRRVKDEAKHKKQSRQRNCKVGFQPCQNHECFWVLDLEIIDPKIHSSWAMLWSCNAPLVAIPCGTSLVAFSGTPKETTCCALFSAASLISLAWRLLWLNQR